MLKIENVQLRVVKEKGAKVEVFITSKEPFLNTSAIYFPEGTDVESGMFDVTFTRRPDAPKEPQVMASSLSPAPAGTDR
jgi:hypothetical protein